MDMVIHRGGEGHQIVHSLLIEDHDGWRSILEPMSYDAVRKNAQLRTALNETVTVGELQHLIVEGLNRDLASAVGRYASWGDWMWDQIQPPTPDLGCNQRLMHTQHFGQYLLRQAPGLTQFIEWHFGQHLPGNTVRHLAGGLAHARAQF